MTQAKIKEWKKEFRKDWGYLKDHHINYKALEKNVSHLLSQAQQEAREEIREMLEKMKRKTLKNKRGLVVAGYNYCLKDLNSLSTKPKTKEGK